MIMNTGRIQSTLQYTVSVVFSIALLFLSGCKPNNAKDQIIKIDIWYGEEQRFGNIGNPQRQINILGNVSPVDSSTVAFFTLNGEKTKQKLTLGSDLHRLAKEGDFNIEIERNELKEGENTVLLLVEKGDGHLAQKQIVVDYTSDSKWPLPYSIDWAQIETVQEAIQVVDGHWKITPNGIRTIDVYYDRVIAIGDGTWRNYEVSTTVTFHGFNPPREGPPTYNVSHVAIASLWPGHDFDSLQPNRKWYPMGATSEFRITDGYQNCRWRIFDGEHFYAEQPEEQYRSLQEGKPYRMKHRVEDISKTETKYSVKLWEENAEEPDVWDFTANEKTENRLEGGSCLLIAHHTEVTFGNIEIVPIASSKE